jgi:alpha-1,3/alpha-1,6-mannosyltransferase
MLMNKSELDVAFIHRDLGIGGGERLVIDAARSLQRAGHRVTLFAGHHDPGHSFEETRNGTLDVRVRPTIFPDHLFQRARIPCNVARMSTLAAGAALSGRFDIVFCDLIPHAIPAVKLFSRAKILYYCHYPDRRIGETMNLRRRLYRTPLDLLEEAGLRLADRILVNSRFTAAQFRKAYPALRGVATEVLYPGVDPVVYAERTDTTAVGDGVMLLSLNRFVRYKNIGLALEALAALRPLVSPTRFERISLVLAGGVDPCVDENAEVLNELRHRARELGIAARVVFKPSCSEAERLRLLSTCRCLVYTSDEEHFGYGLVEAMAARRPVVAVKSGGPLEIVADGETGVLAPPDAQAFAAAVARLICDPAAADRMGKAGRRRVGGQFSLAAFAERLQAIVRDVVSPADRRGLAALSS